MTGKNQDTFLGKILLRLSVRTKLFLDPEEDKRSLWEDLLHTSIQLLIMYLPQEDNNSTWFGLWRAVSWDNATYPDLPMMNSIAWPIGE